MIVEPTLLDHPKFLKLARRLTEGRALILLIRLWGHCQAECRREFWPGADTEYIEAVGRWDGEAGVAFEALKATGFVREEEGGVRIHDWDEMNASMLKRWDNGRQNAKKRGSVDRNPVLGRPKPPSEGSSTELSVDRNPVLGLLRGDEMRGEDTPPTPSGGETSPQQPASQPADPEPEPGFDHASPSAQAAVTDAERVWAIWPKRIDAMAALVAIRNAIERDGIDVVLAGTRAIVEADAKRAVMPPGRYLPKPTEFFDGSRYRDDPAQYGPREAGSPGGVPLGIRVRNASTELAGLELQSKEWWRLHREVQDLRALLLDAEAEPLGVRLREGVELLRHHVGNPDNAYGSAESKRAKQVEWAGLRKKVKSLQRQMRHTNGAEVEP